MVDIAYERSYSTPLARSPLFPMLILSLTAQKNAPSTEDSFMDEYDYIIVGAGAAGSTLASRLTELDCINVLLLEAGISPPLISEVPEPQMYLYGSRIDWNFTSVPQKYTGRGLKDRVITLPQGKTIGGSSTLNGMLYSRGNRINYDDWQNKEGAVGWSYKDVLPYFKKMEDNRNPESVEKEYHGFGGPVTIEIPPYSSEIQKALREGGKSLGYSMRDINGASQIGFYNYQAYLRDGQRCSTAKAYLVPAENRTNLDILIEARVTKILIEDKTATGVQFDYQGKRNTVRARREVIVSAGAINTAQLLMLSGIGPREHLEEFKIPVHADLAVGENLQDHVGAFVAFELTNSSYANSSEPFNEKQVDPKIIRQYIDNRQGFIASIYTLSVVAFLSNDGPNVPPETLPDHELYFLEGPHLANRTKRLGNSPSYEEYVNLVANRTVVWCVSSNLNSKSRGYVRLNSTDPYKQPLVDPNFLHKRRDVVDVVTGLKHCYDVLSSEPMRRLGSKPIDDPPYPGCEDYVGNLDEYLECSARTIVITIGHESGTAKMGNPERPGTVVDPQLRVIGIQKLRVVDASIFPLIPSGNTEAPTVMVAEKASDMIKETIQCS